MSDEPITNEERDRALSAALPADTDPQWRQQFASELRSKWLTKTLLDALCMSERKLAQLELRIATAEQAAADEYESANDAHGLLADLCDILFGDEDRAATHGYEGVMGRAREVMSNQRCATCDQRLLGSCEECGFEP